MWGSGGITSAALLGAYDERGYDAKVEFKRFYASQDLLCSHLDANAQLLSSPRLVENANTTLKSYRANSKCQVRQLRTGENGLMTMKTTTSL